MLLQEAGITQRDLYDARRKYQDDNRFSQSPPVQAFINVINAHGEELEEVGTILQACATEDYVVPVVKEAATEEESDVVDTNKPLGRGIGQAVGSIFAAIQSIFLGNGNKGENGDKVQELMPQITKTPTAVPTMSSVPTVSKSPSSPPSESLVPSTNPTIAPSSIPSAAPSNPVTTTLYLGFHMEAGVLLDGSCSIFFPRSNGSKVEYDDDYEYDDDGFYYKNPENHDDRYSDDRYNDDRYQDNNRPGISDARNLFLRSCFGVEAGMGAEISLLILYTDNRDDDDIAGTSFLIEGPFLGLGPAFSFAVGVNRDAAEVDPEPSMSPTTSPTTSRSPTSSPTTAVKSIRIPSKLSFTFAIESTIPRPRRDEIDGLIAQTEKFFAGILKSIYPNFLFFEARVGFIQYSPDQAVAVVVDFGARADFSTGKFGIV